ncbi:MAG: tetratricopeptide repeat protein [Chrysiogenetes bacterium]|nr:tetratricopeptide repeat protein [Chrysiogenetes bacterium]
MTSTVAAFALTASVSVISALGGFFLFDDYPSIVHNQAVTLFDPGSLHSWWLAAFGSPATLRPVSYLSFAIQWWFSPENPAAMRVVNILLHTGAAVFVYLGLREGLRLLRESVETADERLALLGALLWALHPVQTQPVNFIVQRMTLLAGLFAVATFWLYFRGRRTGQRRWYAWAAGAYGLALLSKENAAVVPVVLVAWEWLLGPEEAPAARKRRFLWLLAACAPPVAMAGIYAATSSNHFALGALPNRDFTLWERTLSAPRMYLRYVGLLFWPYPQALDYGLQPSRSFLDPWTTLPAWAAMGAVLAAIWKWRGRWPIAAFAVLAFVLALAPESTFLNLELFYEHRLYLPSVFVLPLVPWGVQALLGRFRMDARGVAAAMGVLLALAAGRTWARNLDWGDEIRLMEKNVVAYPDNHRARENLAMSLRLAKRLEEAEAQAREAIEIAPGSARAYMVLGEILIDEGDSQQSRASLQKALQLDSSLIRAKLALAKSFGTGGDHEQALRYAREAVAENSRHPEAQLYLGIELMELKEFEKAISHFRIAAELDPKSKDAVYNLGLAYAQAGNEQAAIDAWRRADEIAPNQPDVLRNLGIALHRQGDRAQAMLYFQKACIAGDQQSCGIVQRR